MKKVLLALMATAMFSTTLPAFAHEHGGMDMNDMDMQSMPAMQHDHSSMHDHNMDADCTKECEMLLKNCAQEADSIQERIGRIKEAIKRDGADQAKVDELKVLNAKLREANETLKSLSKPGR
ncbi:hypothetical protein L4X63_09180 [Geomonas sp. Red32]|uniref:hypothetical protein n=1 Tax=Geomonas sp. Red32 TaxID=2912856 RepID=UPI00202CBE84|nr:hypothetical protein [Geomonas sp. Red32]MCM0081760.1 hypothetical protein [Geomonas sp. Red32]